MSDSGKITARFCIAFTQAGHYHVLGADGLSDREMRSEALATIDGEGPVSVQFGEVVLDRPGEIVTGTVVPERQE